MAVGKITQLTNETGKTALPTIPVQCHVSMVFIGFVVETVGYEIVNRHFFKENELVKAEQQKDFYEEQNIETTITPIYKPC